MGERERRASSPSTSAGCRATAPCASRARPASSSACWPTWRCCARRPRAGRCCWPWTTSTRTPRPSPPTGRSSAASPTRATPSPSASSPAPATRRPATRAARWTCGGRNEIEQSRAITEMYGGSYIPHPTDIAWQEVPPVVVLFHEMAHQYDFGYETSARRHVPRAAAATPAQPRAPGRRPARRPRRRRSSTPERRPRPPGRATPRTGCGGRWACPTAPPTCGRDPAAPSACWPPPSAAVPARRIRAGGGGDDDDGARRRRPPSTPGSTSRSSGSTPRCASPGPSPTTVTTRCWCSTAADGDEAAGELLQGAYVTGGDGSDLGATASPRSPGDCSRCPTTSRACRTTWHRASELAPGATDSQSENVSLPLEVRPGRVRGRGRRRCPTTRPRRCSAWASAHGRRRRHRERDPGPLVRPARRGEHGRPDAAVQRSVRGVSAERQGARRAQGPSRGTTRSPARTPTTATARRDRRSYP